ncbi:uncharacterized protein METZ01_LOCUS270156, partial [marine metagenome]
VSSPVDHSSQRQFPENFGLSGAPAICFGLKLLLFRAIPTTWSRQVPPASFDVRSNPGIYRDAREV